MSHRPGVQMDGEHGLWCARGKVRNLSQAVRGGGAHRQRVDASGGYPAGGRGAAGLQRRGELEAAGVCLRAGDRQGYRIPLEHLRWYAAFHRKEDSVHIHMVVFSSNLKEGYLTKQGIRQVKSAFGRRIFRQDLLHIYEQKTEYRDALGRDAERTMAELIAQMETGQLQNENLEQPILELSVACRTPKAKRCTATCRPQPRHWWTQSWMNWQRRNG
ncbi:relaxase MobL [Flavonifractor plautii]|nr:relaxase MobL [Flavonifractor plautii]